MHPVKPEACTNCHLSPALGLTGGEDLKTVRTLGRSEEDESRVTPTGVLNLTPLC